jgi:hypothetical protein
MGRPVQKGEQAGVPSSVGTWVARCGTRGWRSAIAFASFVIPSGLVRAWGLALDSEVLRLLRTEVVTGAVCTAWSGL